MLLNTVRSDGLLCIVVSALLVASCSFPRESPWVFATEMTGRLKSDGFTMWYCSPLVGSCFRCSRYWVVALINACHQNVSVLSMVTNSMSNKKRTAALPCRDSTSIVRRFLRCMTVADSKWAREMPAPSNICVRVALRRSVSARCQSC